MAAFTAPRHENRRSWLYRLRPTASHGRFTPYEGAPPLRSAPFDEVAPDPNRLRWDPPPFEGEADFVDSLTTFAGNGEASLQAGMAIHLYAATRAMEGRVFFNVDGEFLIVPQAGEIELSTELGPIGSNGLANSRDFETPVAAFEDVSEPTEIIQKFGGRLWRTLLDRSPLDVVAWHGNLAPYRYDLSRFNAIGTVGFDHPDPSIFTVLTSPGEVAGTANCDFMIFPPRWMVAEDTFRPPWFHRNVMSEFMGLIHGVYDAKADGFAPGGASLHNCMSGHGPDQATYAKAISAHLSPHKIDGALAFCAAGLFDRASGVRYGPPRPAARRRSGRRMTRADASVATPSMPPGVKLCAPADLADPGVRNIVVRMAGQHIHAFVVRRGGQISGWLDRCPHMGLPLAKTLDDYLAPDGRIACAWHGGCSTRRPVNAWAVPAPARA